MSIKRLLILAAAGLASVATSAAMAGGPQDMSMPAPPPAPVFQPMVYVQGNLGYADVNWNSFSSGLNPFDTAFAISNGDGGFTFGAAAGYQFMRHFAAQFGWQWLPEVKGTYYNNAAMKLRIQSWFLYLAGKIIVPLFNHFSLYGMVGAGFRDLNKTGASTDGEYWNVFLATGMMYHFMQNWYAFAQFMHFPSNHRAPRHPDNAPMANLFTAGLGYGFAV